MFVFDRQEIRFGSYPKNLHFFYFIDAPVGNTCLFSSAPTQIV
jgi:hypothetical protein